MLHRTMVEGHIILLNTGRNPWVRIDVRMIPRRPSGSRAVFVDPETGLVVKIGYAGQCLNEARLWRQVCDTADARHFAPVLAHHARGSWLVQRYIEHHGHRTMRRVVEFEAVMDRHRLLDQHDGNWVVRDRVVVIVDYGL